MEDDLNVKENRRRPQFVAKGKTTSICWKHKDDLHFWQKEDKQNLLLFKMEVNNSFLQGKAILANPSFV
jgi:hypothetical protein